jgi:hypothetical protein
MGSGPNLLRQDGGGVDGGQENDPAFNDVQAILRKFHEKYPGDEDFTKFFLSGGNIKIQELTRLWGDGTYSVGSGLAGDTIYLDKSQIDKLGPEMAADELKRVLTNLANNNGSQTHNFLDGFDPQRFLDNIEANQLPLSVFFRPTQMDGAAAGQFEGGFIAIIENAPGVGLYVVIGQGVTGERLTFAVPPGGNTQLSMGERCLYLATGIGPVAMVVAGKGAGAVIKSLARITPDGLHVPITLEELAQAANLVDNAPKGTLDFIENWRLGGKLYNPAKLESLGKYLDKRGFKLRLDGNDVLPPNVAAGFDGVEKEIIFRRNATEFEVWHELSHLRQYQQLGPDAYNTLTMVQKEQFVFDLLENSKKRWFGMSERERLEAIDYILRIGGIR